MAEDRKATIRISSDSARYVKPGASREDRLAAARGEAGMPSPDFPAVLAFLSRDADPEIRTAAVRGLKCLARDILLQSCASPDTHPRILELLAKLHGRDAQVAELLTANPSADEGVLAAVAAGQIAGATPDQGEVADSQPGGSPTECAADAGEEEEPDPEEPVDEDSEEFRSKYQLAQTMGISEKIKMGMTGDKEWRMLLIKDTNKLISISVIKNPRITEAEVLSISKSSVNNDDILREICVNKEWTKNYQIKKALVENHKTPLHHALRFISALTEKDLTMLSRSKNISSVIATQARRMLLNKKKD
ncbi:MAG: hypothetical protein VB050_01685 [Geobacteraceae bacterium]|nr:hypothetical protein [Geobacteraceae bacterium]